MKTRVFFPLAVILTSAVLATAVKQDEYVLRYDLKANSNEKYKIVMAMQMKVEAPDETRDVTMDATNDFELVTGEIDQEGRASAEMITTNMKVEVKGAPEGEGPPEPPKEIRFKGKLDNRYRTFDMKPVEGITPDQMMMNPTDLTESAIFVELPEGPIKVGDSWKFNLPKNPMLGDKDHALTATLKGLTTYEGVPVYELDVVGDVDFDFDMAEAMKKSGAAGGAGGGGEIGEEMMAAFQIKMTGKIAVSGKAYLAQTGCRLLHSDMNMVSNQSMEMMGIKILISGTTSLKMTYVK